MKETNVEFKGIVLEARAGGLFSVELEGGHTVIAHLSGKIRQNKIQVSVGDVVRVEMTPYDLDKGRITYRL